MLHENTSVVCCNTISYGSLWPNVRTRVRVPSVVACANLENQLQRTTVVLQCAILYCNVRQWYSSVRFCTSQVMDVYNAFGKLLNPSVPNKLFSIVNPNDAQVAYATFLGFKDTVKAAPR